MRQVHVRQRSDGLWGLYLGKACQMYGKRASIFAIARAMREKRKERRSEVSNV